MQTSISLAVVLAASVLAAQNQAATPRKSLAEGLVRQCIERDGLKPPRLESGLEMAAGKGELVLMVRRQDGTLRLEATPRGLGDHGPVPDKSEVAGGIEAEVDVPVGQAPQPKEKPRTTVARLRIVLSDGMAAITTGAGEAPLAAKSIDRTRLQAALRKLFATTKETSIEAQLIMEVTAEVSMQDVLTCWELARTAGFTTVMFSPLGNTRPSTNEERDLIGGLPEKFGWVGKREKGQAIFDGELLILLDGPTRFGEVAPLIMQCARTGIWQIAFAGQQDEKHRFKLPTHLPFDR